MASTKTMGTLFLVIGIVLFVVLGAVAVGLTVRNVQQASWPHAQGVVVHVETYVDRDNDRDRRNDRNRRGDRMMYRPQIEFTAADGQSYTFTSGLSTSEPWTVGDTVDVQYNPDNPLEAKISGNAAWVPWMLGGMALVFGLVFGGVGLHLRRSDGASGSGPGAAGGPGGSGGRHLSSGSMSSGTWSGWSGPRPDDAPGGSPGEPRR
ncbi:DUF3592 domain-containing protein [Propionibacteriaceae bacterium Y2011]|uniref:DUF3592 domain-containing protein n=1 Tax=Microlunatus sp. Y2014 TaxID=3418488 RepID=UPI003B4D8003